MSEPPTREPPIGLAVLTASDKASRGERADASGPAITAALEAAGLRVDLLAYRVMPDEREQIAAALAELADHPGVHLLLTTGGTGLAPRDVTPQATQAVLDYEVPGIAEVMRAESVRITPAGMLSRGVAGVRGRTLIVNLPGSPKAVRETLAAIAPALPHALATLRGEVGEHTRPA